MTDRELQISQTKFDSDIKQRSWIVSIVFHVCALLLLLLITCSPRTEPEELIEITWGGSGGVPGIDAPMGKTPQGTPEGTPKPQQQEQQRSDAQTAQSQAVPETPRNTRNPALETPQEDKPSNTEQTTSSQESNNTPDNNTAENTDTPQGSQDGTGEKPASGSGGNTVGSFGVEGFGTRGWIRSPRATAPAGTNEEGQVILSFKVLPNGAVTGVRPIKTASSRLTQLAMSALRGAAARPLPPNAEQVTINCRITYTFKLQ